jgi:hypothetical protein
MKRVIAITACLFVVLAGAASAWAGCKQVSFFLDSTSPAAAHAHDPHSDSHHNHDNRTAIHCPILEEFLLSASFSASRNDGIERLTHTVVNKLDSHFGGQQLYRSLHGPPGYSRSNNTPPYLFLSVLRI